MVKHGHILEHAPRRLLLRPWTRRCTCGNTLPCPVAASIARQQFFLRPAAPEWANGTRRLPVVQPPHRGDNASLLTPGQQWRTRHNDPQW